MANGRAAMDLMGQWAPSTFAANTKDKKGLGDELGWFPFPTVDGGAARPPSSSAAATASPSARTPRRRRSTS